MTLSKIDNKITGMYAFLSSYCYHFNLAALLNYCFSKRLQDMVKKYVIAINLTDVTGPDKQLAIGWL